MNLENKVQDNFLYHEKKQNLWDSNQQNPMYRGFDSNKFNQGNNYLVTDNQNNWGIICDQNTGNPLGQVKGPFNL